MAAILETERLLMREMDQGDSGALRQILQDPEVMYACEGPFSDTECQSWMDKQLESWIWPMGSCPQRDWRHDRHVRADNARSHGKASH